MLSMFKLYTMVAGGCSDDICGAVECSDGMSCVAGSVQMACHRLLGSFQMTCHGLQGVQMTCHGFAGSVQICHVLL